jgi:hypothetical protein
MTAPAPQLDAVASPTPPRSPRLLRAVPTAPPYDDDEALELVTAVVPLGLLIPGGSGGTLDLPALARFAEDAEPDAEERRVEAELRRLFGRQRTARADLPAPGPRAAAALRLLLEVVVGERPSRQVAGWVSPRVLAGLDQWSPRQRAGLGRRPVLRSVRVTEPAESVAEVSAVVLFGDRIRAVALRLEGLDGRWTVTALHVG